MVGIDFAVNAILNAQKQVVSALAGDPFAVMAAGIPRARALYQAPVSQPFDLTLVSPGGHPKDINIYQSQKGHGSRRGSHQARGRHDLVRGMPGRQRQS